MKANPGNGIHSPGLSKGVGEHIAQLDNNLFTMKGFFIISILKEEYPNAGSRLNFSNPLELLIASILAAQCTDDKVNEVTKSLFRKYRTAKDYAEVDLDELMKEIYSTGTFRRKAIRIKTCCEAIVSQYGGEIPSRMDDLTNLPGVGRKTANLVLNRAFGIPAIAVDTHVHRISNLLEWVKTTTPEKTEVELTKILPKKYWSDMNRLFVSIGRQYTSKPKLVKFLKENGLI